MAGKLESQNLSQNYQSNSTRGAGVSKFTIIVITILVIVITILVISGIWEGFPQWRGMLYSDQYLCFCFTTLPFSLLHSLGT